MGKEKEQKDVLKKLEENKNKYVNMAKNRNDFNTINPKNFLTPDMDEMMQEDLMSEIYQQYVDKNTDGKYTDKNILDSYFYVENPFTTSPGHYTEEGAFVLKVNPSDIPKDGPTWDLNKFDGDTWSFNLKNIDDGGQSVMFTNGKESVKYNNFKDFYKKMGGGEAVQVRAIGINAMEIPHYEIQVAKENEMSKNSLVVNFKDMKEMINGKTKILYEKCPLDENKKPYKRKDDDKVYLWKVSDNNGITQYTEIIKRIDPSKYITEKKSGYKYFVVLGKDDSTEGGILDGYAAQKAAKEVLNNAEEIVLVLNANGIKTSKNTSNNEDKTFNSIYYLYDTVKFMVKEWEIYYGDLPITNYSYIPYGMDNYKRCLGVVYVKYKGKWINLSKYVLCNTKKTIANPSFNDSPELQEIGSGISNSFNLWSYDRNNIEWLDSFNKISEKSYQDRLDLHKQLTGIDFTKVRNCALFIGDTLMLIPPESIRNITQSAYERIPNMRSKGTQAKHKGNNEQMLELTLYFYEDTGINGINYVYTTPNGTSFEYKMDGLRSLIAQFKIAPFLPIENGYINDVLGIEAVALSNLSIQNVNGFPRLLKVILTLREFNYRIYMPDMPLDKDTGNDQNEYLAEMPPLFAKSFNWEIFRYYYQRAIIAGTKLSLIDFNSYDYNLQYYSHKNTVGPWWYECGPRFNKGEVSFYIPDENWLANALQVKKDRDTNLLTPTASIDLSDNAKAFVKTLSKLAIGLDDIQEYKNENFNKCIDNLIGRAVRGEHRLGVSIPFFLDQDPKKEDNIVNTGITKVILYSNDDGGWDIPQNNIDLSLVRRYIKPMQTAFIDAIGDPAVCKDVTINESIWKDANKIIHVVWDFCIELNLSKVTNEDWSNIKEVLGKNNDKNTLKPSDLFKDDKVNISYEMTFTEGSFEWGKGFKINGLNISDPKNSKLFKNTFVLKKSNDIIVLKNLINGINKENAPEDLPDDDPTNKYNKEIEFYVKDYKNPANMPYVPYLENILCTNMMANMSNSFTEISLKAIEGYGPQYIGGQDIQLELNLITDDITIVSALNSLPNLASATAKTYRKILPAWPIKIKSDLTSMLGVSEVLIDAIEVDTVEGFPGVYSIAMKLTSVDRTQRQREALRRLDVRPEGGETDYYGNSNLSMKNYFNINNALSKVELYPDLDLPSLEELGKLGFRFVKYSGQNRSYPDPDFYIVYAYPYTSLIIKKMVKDGLSKNLFKTDEDPSHMFKFKDIFGAELTGKVEAYTGLSVDSIDNEKAQKYYDVMSEIERGIENKLKGMKNLSKEDKQTIEDRLGLATAIKKLVMADMSDGWEIRPGWRAPLADLCVDDAIKKMSEDKKDAFAKEIKTRRTKCIQLIDKILSKPIEYREYDNASSLKRKDNYKKICTQAVNDMFGNGEGKELLEILCPTTNILKMNETASSLSDDFSKGYFDLANPIAYMIGFLFTSGCALSGNREYASKIKEKDWYPNHYLSSANYPNKDNSDTEYKGYFLPYCLCDKIAGKSSYALSIKEGIDDGTVFGAWRIVKYSDSKIVANMTNKDSNIKYVTDKDSAYSKEVSAGFLDPYYNKLSYNDKELKKYKESILVNIRSNAEAFLRNMLLHLRKMIVDGLIISELDIIANDWKKIFYDNFGFSDIPNDKPEIGNNPYQYNGYINLFPMKDDSKDKPMKDEDVKSVTSGLKVLGFDEKEMKDLMYAIQKSSKKAFCARLIYPFIAATTRNANDLYELINSRDYQALNNLTGYAESGSGLNDSKLSCIKFLSSMNGINMSLADRGKNSGYTSESQKIINSLMKDIFITASEDPRAYILHSFYDMLTNDKRGRLVRAFPTYYVVFIDEGRKFGSWKLHDNFYNMNSISSINIVKSRKIAADTCTLVMNNTFNSYTMEPDSTTTQQYADIYGLRDVFDSIFSPKAYFDKEKRIRLRKNLPDTVVLQPGIRLHVRMGYSADGSKLPVVFNGKVAEVEIAEVAQLVAQGDGDELMNPLSAFGEIEALSLDAAQSTITWFKDLRGQLSKGGESPRDLIAKILTAKYGGWKKAVDYVFDGRWFNDNAFGIMHFGDPRFKNIFEQGEVVQNLYEVADNSLLKGINEFSSVADTKKLTPILNTSLQDKTFWDLLHLAANSGINYVGAIRDFGFRSTVFLGKPNHYYAYDYVLVDNKIVEKRKPFQQFHYIDSYTDIIYNSIKASEAQLKTNAIGIWQSSSPWWGREQSTVGPIYVDMNIYPEYQKTMTVDTGLLAAGDGGIDLGIIQHFSEEWATDVNDVRVNKATAWRVTANALKNAVKDMYLGDIGILGDPSIKPHDRIYLHDTHEDMMGQFEVEAVIHNMSVETGFTTSVMPDVIARHQDEKESANQSIMSTAGGMLAFGVGLGIADKVNAYMVNGKLTTVIAKSKNMYGKTGKLLDVAGDLCNATGMKEFLSNKPTAKSLFESLNVFMKKDSLNLNGVNTAIDALSEIKPNSLNKWDDIASALLHYSRLDVEEYTNSLKTAYGKNKFGSVSNDITPEKLDDIVKEIKNTKVDLDGKINYKKLNLNEFAEEIKKISDKDGDLVKSLSRDSRKILDKWSAKAYGSTEQMSKDLAKMLNEDKILKAIENKTLKTNSIDDYIKSFKTLFELDDATKVTKFAKVADTLKGGKLLDVLKDIAEGAMKLNPATLLIDLAIETVIFVMIKNAQEVFTRFLEGIQAVDVYPLKKNNKPLIAGMNGHKGSVYGWPVKEGYDSIQGMILQFIDGIKKIDGDLPIADWVLDQFVDKGTLESLSKEWRKDLGIEDDENKKDEDLVQNIYDNVSSSYSAKNQEGYAMMVKPRIKAPNKDNFSADVLKQYKIQVSSPIALATNSKVLKLNGLINDPSIKAAVLSGRFEIAHSDKPTSTVNIPFERGIEAVPIKVDKDIIDMPLVSDELIWLLSKLLSEPDLKKIKIKFKSGARANDEKGTWRSTGYSMVLEVNKNADLFKKVLDKYVDSTNILKDSDGVFKYKQDGKKFNIMALAPLKSNNIK